MKKALKQLLFAFTFLTVIPGPRKLHIEPEDMGKSTSLYPIVGAFIGICLFLLSRIHNISNFTKATIIVVFMLLITRGLHADGLIDTFDGFLSGKKNREEIIRIMRDSKIGALGFITAFSVYILKVSFIYEILLRNMEYKLIYLPILSRSGVAFAGFLFSYPENQKGLGKSFVDSIGVIQFIISFLISSILVFSKANYINLLFTPIAFLMWTVWGIISKKKIGGITGDTIGAGIELTELFLILMLIFI